MRVLYWDCPAGIAGDMALGSLFDAGVSPQAVEGVLRASGLDGFTLEITKVNVHGLAATRVNARVTAPQPHRRLPDLEAFLQGASFTPKVREQAGRVFRRLAEAEAKVHGISVNEVHFHEVGAVDALVEVVGVCLALETLRIDRVVVSPLPLGSGFVTCAHGLIPLPAPATLELLRGLPTHGVDVEGELVTPTGAALAAGLAAAAGPSPAMRLETIGYGAGSHEFTFPNVLRAVIGEGLDDAGEPLVTLETNLDDLNPEVYPHIISRLLDEGAREAYLTPVIMKKGRPGVLLTVLALEHDWRRLAALIMRETGTLGLRMQRNVRLTADRCFYAIKTCYGAVQVKVASFGGQVIQVKPEFEDCRSRAAEAGIPVREVLAEAATEARRCLPQLFQQMNPTTDQ